MASQPPSFSGSGAGQAYVQPQPAWQITANGVDLADKLDPRTVSITVTEKLGEAADDLEIELHDADGLLTIPPSGATIAVSIGWAKGVGVRSGLVSKGTFTADEPTWSGPPDKLTLKGRSADLVTSYRTRKNATWTNSTLGAITSNIAGDNGLKPRCHPDLAATTVTSAEQANQSDMEFIRNLGRRYDAVATVKGGALILAPVNAATTASGATIPTLIITRAMCSSYSYSRPARDGAQDGAEAQHYDQSEATRKTVHAGGSNRRRLKRIYASAPDASAAATSTSNRIARAKGTFSVTLSLGDATIGAGYKATTSGFKPEIDAIPWRVTTVKNTMGPGGFITELEFEVAA